MDTKASCSRAYELDLLRVCACLAVVLLHVSVEAWDTVPLTSAGWQVANISLLLGRLGVPSFLMISGALFLSPQRVLTPRLLVGKYLLRLVTAFLFWSGWYCLRNYVLPAGEITKKALFYFLVPSSHLWYFSVIIGLYLATPLLRLLCQKKEHAQYFLLLGFLFSICWNAAKLVPALYDRLNSTMEPVSFLTGIGYAVYFVAGYYLKTWKIKKGTRLVLYVAGALSALFVILGTSAVSLREGKAVGPFYDSLMPFIFFPSIAVFLLFQDCFSAVSFREGTKKTLLTLSKLSFGIYLVHIQVLESIRSYGLHAWQSPVAIFIPLITLCVYAVSLFIIWILSKIPVLNKYIL